VRSAVIDYDLNFENEYAALGVHEFTYSSNGRPVNKYSVGLPLALLPVYLIAHLVVTLMNLAGVRLDASGYSAVYQFAYSAGSILYGYMGLIACQKLLFNYIPVKTARFAVVVVLLSSNLLYYFLREPFISHLVSFFATAHFFLWWSLARKGGGGAGPLFWMGASAGLMVLTRQQDALFILLPLIDSLLHALVERKLSLKRRLVSFMVFAAGLIPFVVLQLAVWRYLFGSWIAYSYSGESFLYAAEPKIVEVLFSSRHGLISWNPVWLIGLAGLTCFVRVERRLTILMFLGFVMQLYLNASWHNWWFGHSFGHRGFISLLPVAMLGVGVAVNIVLSRIDVGWLVLLSLILIAWNWLMIIAYMSELVPQDGYFEWGDMVIRMCELPRALMGKIQELQASP
jgi:hypothetical protein